MSEINDHLKYNASHEWVEIHDDGTVTIGISDHAQSQLGDLVFVELPEVGDTLEREGDCAVVESVKAASDVYSPLCGEVIAINGNLEDDPSLINQHPYTDGWLFKLKLSDPKQLDELLDSATYRQQIEVEDD